MQTPRNVRFYVLGRGFAALADGTLVKSWPYEVSYAPEFRPADIYLAEGDAHHGNGGFFPPAALLRPEWRKHLEVTQSAWLIPFIEQLAPGKDILLTALLDAYAREHGQLPPHEDRVLYE